MTLNILCKEDLDRLDAKLDIVLTLLGQGQGQHTKPYYTNKELTSLLDISPKTLQQYRNSKKIEFNQVDRKIFYTQKAVDDFLHRFKMRAKSVL